MKYAHPYTKTAQGVLMDWSDDLPREAFVALDNALSAATDAAKDVEAERDAAVARAEKSEVKVSRVQDVLDDAWIRLSPDAEQALKEAIA